MKVNDYLHNMKMIADQTSNFMQFLMVSTQFVVVVVRPYGDEIVSECVEAEMKLLGLENMESNLDFVEKKYNLYRNMQLDDIHSKYPISDHPVYFEYSVFGKK